jgi:hypothetical protein
VSRLALISDIHGNGVAVDDVLADIARDKVDDIICLGRVPVDLDAVAAATTRMPHRSWARDLATRIARWNARG